jgi:hypothetical protein
MAPRTRRGTARTERRRRRGTREEGIVMLVVLLILMLATMVATTSMMTVQSELRSNGNDRVRVQAQYLAETGIMSTLSWMDVAGDGFQVEWDRWEAEGPPVMTRYGDPAFRPELQGVSGRMMMSLHDSKVEFQAFADLEVAPVDEGTDGTGIGSFGPPPRGIVGDASLYRQVTDGYYVDITDCQEAPNADAAGSNADGSTGSRQLCTLTARAQLALGDERGQPTDDAVSRRTRKWRVDGADYLQSAFIRSYEARAMVLTPLVAP